MLRALVKTPLIEVGEFSYYDYPDDPTAFETRNVLYHYGPEKLAIGRFCALGTGVRFIMDGANHRTDGPSTFPFPTLGGSWADTSTCSPACRTAATRSSTTMSGSALARRSCPASGSGTGRSSTPAHMRTIISGGIADLEAALPDTGGV
ncbi:hypothetical protein GCM10027074_53590 [Streptomyces deserti]